MKIRTALFEPYREDGAPIGTGGGAKGDEGIVGEFPESGAPGFEFAEGEGLGGCAAAHAGKAGGKTEGVKSSETVATFTFGTQEIRVAGTKESPLFCVADICAVLELANPTMAVANHPEEEKGLSSFETVGRGSQKLVCVTEPGLYRLIFRSYKPKAAEFQRWVFHEVLPALRHTGHYAIPGRIGEAVDIEGRVTTLRTKLVTTKFLSMWTGEIMAPETQRRVTEACGVPLFSYDGEVCRGCARGWWSPHNFPTSLEGEVQQPCPALPMRAPAELAAEYDNLYIAHFGADRKAAA